MNSVDALTKASNGIVFCNSVMQNIAKKSLIANATNCDAKGNARIYVIRILLFVNICLSKFLKFYGMLVEYNLFLLDNHVQCMIS